MYLATYTNKVPVYDVTAPLVPVMIGEATVPDPYGDGVHDLFATHDMIYANSTTAGPSGRPWTSPRRIRWPASGEGVAAVTARRRW